MVANSDVAFNGHKYVSFGSGTGLATANALFTGASPRSVAAVYAVPFGDVSNTNANDVNPIAGEAEVAGQNNLFILQSRDSGSVNGAVGDPYLALYANDLTSGNAPFVNQLTFTLATYDGTNTATLYWAYGTTGAVQSVSKTVGVINTQASQFTIGYDKFGESSLGNMNIGQVQVFESSLNSTAATAEIQSATS